MNSAIGKWMSRHVGHALPKVRFLDQTDLPLPCSFSLSLSRFHFQNFRIVAVF